MPKRQANAGAAPDITPAHVRAAFEATGEEEEPVFLQGIFDQHGHTPARELRASLQRKTRAFEELGGYGIVADDEVDELKVAVAWIVLRRRADTTSYETPPPAQTNSL